MTSELPNYLLMTKQILAIKIFTLFTEQFVVYVAWWYGYNCMLASTHFLRMCKIDCVWINTFTA